MSNDLNDSADAQDRAEVFDETNLTRDGEDIAHPDVARDVLDVTSEPEDSDPDDDGPAAHEGIVEKHLDHGLEETFPASDPVSISPGAD